jgi:hypothetical protein
MLGHRVTGASFDADMDLLTVHLYCEQVGETAVLSNNSVCTLFVSVAFCLLPAAWEVRGNHCAPEQKSTVRVLVPSCLVPKKKASVILHRIA